MTLKVVFLDHFLDFEAKYGIVQETSWAFNITELILILAAFAADLTCSTAADV